MSASLGTAIAATIHFAASAIFAPAATQSAPPPPEQAVIIYLKLSDDHFGAPGESAGLYEIEDAVGRAVRLLGEVDGHEIGDGYFVIYTYGPDADALFNAVEPAVDGRPLPRGSYVLVRRGGPGAPSARIELTD